MLQEIKQEMVKRGKLIEAWHIACKAKNFCVTLDSCTMHCLNMQTCFSNSRPIQSHFWEQNSFWSAPSECWHHSKTLQERNRRRHWKHTLQDILDRFHWSQMQSSPQSKQSSFYKVWSTTWRSASHLEVKHFVISAFWTQDTGHQHLAYGMVSHKWNDCAGGSIFVKTKQLMVWEISLSMQTIPCSLAECERGFNLMTNICTDKRATILLSNENNFMMSSISGPPVRLFQLRKYITTWLRSHCSATQAKRQSTPQMPEYKHCKVCRLPG